MSDFTSGFLLGALLMFLISVAAIRRAYRSVRTTLDELRKEQKTALDALTKRTKDTLEELAREQEVAIDQLRERQESAEKEVREYKLRLESAEARAVP